MLGGMLAGRVICHSFTWRLLCVMTLMLATGSALTCVKCTSLQEKDCLDGLGPHQVCVPNENFCVSYTGYIKQGVAQVLFRGCSATNMSDTCRSHVEPLREDRLGRLLVCYRTCDEDLCNTHRMDYSGTSSARGRHDWLLPGVVFVLLVAIVTPTMTTTRASSNDVFLHRRPRT